MSTFANELVTSMNGRWAEVDLLLRTAESAQRSNPDLHDAICRSVVVLIAAHLESFVRDAAKAMVDDTNRFSEFKALPRLAKRAFCRDYTPEGGRQENERAERLIVLLDGLETKLTLEPFLYAQTNDGHKNPSPSVIERVARNFGVKEAFKLIASSTLDDAFNASENENDAKQASLVSDLTSGTTSFPYSINAETYGLHTHGEPVSGRTLWETFLDDLMQRRNRIAHGTSTHNTDSVTQLRADLGKVRILQCGLLILLCSSVSVAAAATT